MIVTDGKFPTMGIDGVDALVSFYKQYDCETNEIRNKYGFYCLPGCGACCNTPSFNIEVAVFEMIPLAIQFALEGRGDAILKQLENDNIEKVPCIIYTKISEDGSMGHCSEYSLRPLICRLFGGGVWKKKDLSHEMLLCKLLKEEHRLNQDMIDKLTKEFPLVLDVSAYARGLNPVMDQQLFSINVSLKKALEYVMFRMQWYSPDSPEPDSPPLITPQGGIDHAA